MGLDNLLVEKSGVDGEDAGVLLKKIGSNRPECSERGVIPVVDKRTELICNAFV